MTISSPPTAPRPSRDEDIAVARRVLEGDVRAWHEFVARFDGLIHHVLRRYTNHDDERDAWHADVLEELRERKLAAYDGRSSLSTWVALIARNLGLDRMRHRFGRRSAPGGVARLPERDRRVYTLYYEGGVDLEGVARHLSANGEEVSRQEVLEALWRIREVVADRTLRRILDELAPPPPRVAAAELLEHLAEERPETADDPEARLLRREARALASEVLAYVDGLPEGERRLLELRHREGRSAQQIADELRLPNRRKAYSLLDGIYRKIRGVFGARWSETGMWR